MKHYPHNPKLTAKYQTVTAKLDYILVSADGREIVAERHDANGAYIEDSLEWKDFRKFLDCEIVNSWIF